MKMTFLREHPKNKKYTTQQRYLDTVLKEMNSLSEQIGMIEGQNVTD